MEHVNTVIIGAGQAGLSASYYLKQADQEHILLEKDRIGEAWRSGKWDSFTLVTPNWMLQLPGFSYEGDDSTGFLTREEVVQYLEEYARRIEPPVRTGVEVTSVQRADQRSRFLVKTDSGQFAAANVVVATGTFQRPRIPSFQNKLPSGLHQIHSSEYRNPDKLPEGPVLIVGSGQSGCQIADELNEHGRKVYLCTGEATRLPRRYRGHDSFWWADKLGIFDHTVEDLPSPKARFKANPQVSGKHGGKTLGLHHLAAEGVVLLGYMQDTDGRKISIADDLKKNLARADQFSAEFKKGVDQFIDKTGMNLPEESTPELRTGYDAASITELDIDRAGIIAARSACRKIR